MDLVVTGWRHDWPNEHSREWDGHAAVTRAFSASMQFGGSVSCEPFQPLSSCRATLPPQVVLAFDLEHGISQASWRIPGVPGSLRNFALGDHGNSEGLWIGGTEITAQYIRRRKRGVKALIAFCRSRMGRGARLLLAGCEVAKDSTRLQQELARAIGIEGLIISAPVWKQKTGMMPASDAVDERRMIPYWPGIEGPIIDVQWFRSGGFSQTTRYWRAHTAFENNLP
jgi:hypothetical protein